MKKVSKDIVEKVIRSAGLFPVEDSWQVYISKEYDRWHGNSTYYKYLIEARSFDPLCNDIITIVGDKESGFDATFSIQHSTQKLRVDAEYLVKKFQEGGWEADLYIISDKNLQAKITNRLQRPVYTSDLIKIADILRIEK
jgi:hypothetical protein